MFSSPFPDVEIPDVSVFDYLFGSLDDTSANRVALTDGATGETTTYGELVRQVEAVAGALAARGIGVGSVVALHSPNRPAFAVAFYGILRAGATVTTVNALSTAGEMATQLTDSKAIAIIAADALFPVSSKAGELAGVAAVSIVSLGEVDGGTSLADLVGEAHPAPDVSFDPATHLAVLLNIALAQRTTLVTMARFDLADFLGLIQSERITYVFIAPPIAVALAKHPLVAEFDLSSLRTVFSGAAPLDGIVGGAVAERLNCEVLQGYGMTEMSPVSHAMPRGRTDIPLNSVGLTVPNMQCRIVDPLTGDDIEIPTVGVSEPGELLCRGPNVMVGYLGNDEATLATLDADGFLHTGDIATVSAEGFVTIVDRLKELIKYKGYQVAPAELEALLLGHPQIADAAVIGVIDANGEEVPKAFLKLQPEATLTGEDVMIWVAERVAPHKKVRQVEMIDFIPKSASGKILRKDLRSQGALL